MDDRRLDMAGCNGLVISEVSIYLSRKPADPRLVARGVIGLNDAIAFRVALFEEADARWLAMPRDRERRQACWTISPACRRLVGDAAWDEYDRAIAGKVAKGKEVVV